GLTDFFMDHVPGYNKFRAVSMIMVIAELTLPLLALLAVNELVKHKNWSEKIKLRLINKEVSLKNIVITSVSIVGGFCLLCYLMPDAFNTFQSRGEEQQMIGSYIRGGYPESEARAVVAELMPQIEIARKGIFTSDAIRSLIFILLAFGALFLFLTGKLKKELFFGALGLFIVIDLWTVDTRYLNDKSFVTKEQNQQSVIAKTPTDDEILKDPALDYRVLNIATNTFNDASTSYYHKSVGGYHGAKLKKYQELVDFHLDEEINIFRKNAGKAFANDTLLQQLLSRLNVINMLNTKYIVIPTGENKTMPLPNPQANGNAWIVKNLKFVLDGDSEIVGLYYINTKTQALVNKSFRSELGLKDNYEGEGQIKMISYEPNDLVYESDTKAEEFAVFSEIYYPKGWNAYIDGQLKPHANVDYVLRGLVIPAGKHKIEFKFEPKSYTTGNTIAMIGSILLLITVGIGLYLNKKNNVIVS
ncbi:MAG: YfhO family protein, partial [Bacteroidia bacterium]